MDYIQDHAMSIRVLSKYMPDSCEAQGLIVDTEAAPLVANAAALLATLVMRAQPEHARLYQCVMEVACFTLFMLIRRDDLFTSMLPKYQDILRHDANLDILVFSGDVDGIVPVIGTRRWLASLQLPIIKEWRPWYSRTGKHSLPFFGQCMSISCST